jgi:hypothetical protein
MEPGISGSVARNFDHKTTDAVFKCNSDAMKLVPLLRKGVRGGLEWQQEVN